MSDLEKLSEDILHIAQTTTFRGNRKHMIVEKLKAWQGTDNRQSGVVAKKKTIKNQLSCLQCRDKEFTAHRLNELHLTCTKCGFDGNEWLKEAQPPAAQSE